MNTKICFVIVAAAIFSFFSFSIHAEDKSDLSQAVLALDWKDHGSYDLELSQSTIIIPDGFIAVINEDARKCEFLMTGEYSADLEALLIRNGSQDKIRMSYSDGHTSVKDWKKVNAAQLLEEISKNTAIKNSERQENGLSKIRIVGWVQKPTVNTKTKTVMWAYEVIDEDDEVPIINAITLKLGRHGFEKVLWVTDKQSFETNKRDLGLILDAHSFNPGNRYSEYTIKDMVTSYGPINFIVFFTIGLIIKKFGLFSILRKIYELIGRGFCFAKTYFMKKKAM